MPYKNGVWVIDTQEENGNRVLTQAQKAEIRRKNQEAGNTVYQKLQQQKLTQTNEIGNGAFTQDRKAEIRRKNQEAGSTLMQKATAAKYLPTQEKVTKISNEVLPTTILQKQSARNTLENSGAVREQRNQAQAQRRAQKQAETAAPLLMNGQLQKRSAKNTFDNAGSVTQKSDFNDYAEAGRQLYERQQNKKQQENVLSRKDAQKVLQDREQQQRFDAMNNDERRVYFYKLAKDGQESADSYLRTLRSALDARTGVQQAEALENEPNSLLKALGYAEKALTGGIAQSVQGSSQFLSGEVYNPTASQVASQKLGSDLTGAGKYLYQAGTSIGNMLPSVAVSLLSGGLGAPAVAGDIASGLTTALGSGGNAYGEAKRQGYSELQSRTYGTLIGASEAALEKVLGGISELRGGVSLTDKLLEKVSGIENGLARWALSGVINIGSEINEEEVQNFLEPLFRTVIFGEEYKAPSIEELVDTAITTAISTGIMELGHTTEYQPYDENATTLDRAMMDTMAGRQTQENVSQTQDSNLDRVMQQTFEQYKNPAASEQTTGSPLDGSVRSDAAEAGTTNISDSKGKVKGDIPISRNVERPDAESSVGAAAYGFDPYTNAANQYGTIEPGENPARVVDVPVSMDGETKVSKFARTAAEAKITTDEMVGKIEQLVTDGKLSHEVYSNKQALEDGAQQIVNQYARGKTIEQIRSEFVRDANAGKAGAKLVARGTTLYADAIAAKDYQAASDILVALTAVETNAGQSVQAARLLKSMTPEGRIFTIQRMISNLEAQVNKNLKKPKELNVPDSLLDAYQNAETESAQKAALDNIYKNVAEQIPTTLREGLQQWRYFSMLANPSTHLKNIMGNVSGAIAKIGKDNLAALGEMIVIGNNEGRTKAFLNPLRKADKSLLDAAWADYDTAVDLYEDSVGKYSTSTGGVNDYRRYWKINDPQNALARGVDQFLAKAEKLNDLNSKALEAEDMWFSKPMYTASLASYMKANHLTEITDEARTYAMGEAKRGTYNDLNTVSKWATRFGNNSKIGRFLSGVIYPFKKVPANVMVRTVEYSPLGYVKGLYDIVQMQRGNTDITVAQTIDDFAAATTGTILLGIGAAMAKQGILRATGVGDDEEKEQQKNAFGAKDFSILIGDTYVPIDSLTLTGTGLLTGAQIWESAQNARNGDEPISLNDIMDALSKITDPVFEQSMLSGLDSVISTIQNSSKDEKNGEMFAKMGVQILGNYIGQYVPTLVGRIASSVDKNQRSTYIEPDGAWAPVQSAIQGVQRKVPGWREDMAITRGNWGVPVEGNGAGGIANSAFKAVTPVYPSRTKTDPVEEEIARLHSVNSDFSNFYTKPKKLISVDGKNVKLTSGQYDKYTEVRGQTDYSIRKTMLNSDVYKSVPDSIKSKAMELSQQYANEIGKEAAGVGYSASDKWITDLAGKSDDEIAKEILKKAALSVGGLAGKSDIPKFTELQTAGLRSDVVDKMMEKAESYADWIALEKLGYDISDAPDWIHEAKSMTETERQELLITKAVESQADSYESKWGGIDKMLDSGIISDAAALLVVPDDVRENYEETSSGKISVDQLVETVGMKNSAKDVNEFISLLNETDWTDTEKAYAYLTQYKSIEKMPVEWYSGLSKNILTDPERLAKKIMVSTTDDQAERYKETEASSTLPSTKFAQSANKYMGLKPDYDENGEAIDGSKNEKFIRYLNNTGWTDAEKATAYAIICKTNNMPEEWYSSVPDTVVPSLLDSEKAEKLEAAGGIDSVPADKVMIGLKLYNTLSPDKNKNGNTISNSKMKKFRKAIDEQEWSSSEKKAVFTIFYAEKNSIW